MVTQGWNDVSAQPFPGARVLSPHGAGGRHQSTQDPAYLCLMELPRSLRGICGDQRGTDSVSAGREERRRDCYTEGLRLAGVGSSQTLERRWTLTGLRKDTNHITRQTKAKWKTGLACVISTHAGFPGSGSRRAFETKRAVQKTEHRFHLLSAQCVPGTCC